MKLLFFLYIFLQISVFSVQAQQNNLIEGTSKNEHNTWLKEKFSEQHNQLIPIVAVADIFITCYKQRKIGTEKYQLKQLILEMNKDLLAQKLSSCLGDDTVHSDIAINFGLLGCFSDQLSHLSKVEQMQKLKLVKKAIASLSSSERKKSFTQCVTEQAIHYLR